MPIDTQRIARRGPRSTALPAAEWDAVSAIHQHDEQLARLLSRMPREVAGSFTEAQLLAVKAAVAEQFTRGHQVDIRVTLPLLLRRYYLVLLAGPEKRDRARRRRERRKHPLLRVTNIMFVNLVVLLLLAAVAVSGFLIASAFDAGSVGAGGSSAWEAVLQQFRLMGRP